ncbi:MAG: YtxH domain-containing protein [Candidatus Gracilibacteria bacterium]|jgi:gas vesicle protein
MFGFGKRKNKDQDRKKSKLDKLVMGAIVGGAIGSVIGMTIAPQKGAETREMLAQKGKDVYAKGKEVGGQIQSSLEERLADRKEKMGSVPKKKGFFGRLKDKIFHKKIKNKQISLNEKDFKKIPHEMD